MDKRQWEKKSVAQQQHQRKKSVRNKYVFIGFFSSSSSKHVSNNEKCGLHWKKNSYIKNREVKKIIVYLITKLRNKKEAKNRRVQWR